MAETRTRRAPARQQQPAQEPPAPEPEREVVHPASDLAAAVPLFRRPFTPAAVSFKIQVNPKKQGEGQQVRYGKGLVVLYIEARTAAERLNVVAGAAWEDDYDDLFAAGPKGFGVKCRLHVFDRTRADVSFILGSELANEKEADKALKGGYSDAFKRACVKYGIGAFLYFTPKLYVEATELKLVGGKWYLPPATERKLRERYGQWLAMQATIERFGVALDHGDVSEAQGDIETTPPAEPPPDDQDEQAVPAGDTDKDGAVAEQEAEHAEHEATATPDQEADAALDAAREAETQEQAIERLRALYAESACTKAEYQAKLTQMGLSDIYEADPDQIAALTDFFQSRTPA